MSKGKYVLVSEPGDPAVIRALCDRLFRVYDDFINNFEGEVSYVEGFMAAHNFHVYIIDALVRETGEEVWRKAALDTFSRRMERPGEFDTKVGFGDDV